MTTELAKRSLYEFPHPEKNGTENELEILPATDIFEDEDKFTLYFEIPGANSSTVTVEVANGILCVRAKSSLIRRGRPVVFHRDFQLARSIDVEKISAQTTDGVLTLQLPKSAQAKIHRIKVS